MSGIHNWTITCLIKLIVQDRAVVTLILSQIAIKGFHKRYYRAISIYPDDSLCRNVFKLLYKYIFSLRKRQTPSLSRVLTLKRSKLLITSISYNHLF